MNKPITLKITLALFFVSICQLTLRAQDTTKKSNPAPANVPASSNPLSSAYQNQPNNTVPMPVRTSPMDHPVVKMTNLPGKKTPANATVITPNLPANAGTTVSPAMAPKVSPSIGTSATSSPANSAPAKAPIRTNQSGYTAPTTAERSVTPTLVPRKVTPIMVPVKVPATQASNITPPPTTSTPPPATNTTAVVPPVSLPVMTSPSAKDTSAKKDPLIAKKDTAKKDSLLAKADSAKKDTSDADSIGFQKQRIVFAEIGGPGLAISANYDMRVTIGQNNRFGFRIGAGYFKSGNNYVFTIPFQANYLYGKDGKYLEFGLGTTFLKSDGDNYSSKNFIFDKITGLIATGTIGIRYVPANSHVNFRLAYVPIIDDDGLVNIGGFSVGYTF